MTRIDSATGDIVGTVDIDFSEGMGLTAVLLSANADTGAVVLGVDSDMMSFIVPRVRLSVFVAPVTREYLVDGSTGTLDRATL